MALSSRNWISFEVCRRRRIREAARSAGLRYVSERMPGTHRRAGAAGRITPDGSLVRQGDSRPTGRVAIRRVGRRVDQPQPEEAHPPGGVTSAAAVYLPPAIDAVRDQRKFDKLLLFGEALPLIRSAPIRTCGGTGGPREGDRAGGAAAQPP